MFRDPLPADAPDTVPLDTLAVSRLSMHDAASAVTEHALRATHRNGVEHGLRLGFARGSSWGMLVGATWGVCGSLLVGLALRAAGWL
jgi:uncharacterized membrane protein